MSTDKPAEAFKKIIELLAEALRHRGYVKRGNSLRKISGEGVALVEFQKSVKNTADSLSFTINLAIALKSLMAEDAPELRRVGTVDAQLSERIGMLLAAKRDKWWVIDSDTDIDALEREIVQIVEERGVPYLEAYLEPAALATLWETGHSPGLTDVQRKRYLSRLRDVGVDK